MPAGRSSGVTVYKSLPAASGHIVPADERARPGVYAAAALAAMWFVLVIVIAALVWQHGSDQRRNRALLASILRMRSSRSGAHSLAIEAGKGGIAAHDARLRAATANANRSAAAVRAA